MDFFYLLLQASFISVFAIIFVLLFRAVLKDKLDRRVFILLWAVIIFRLIIVDSIVSPVSFSQVIPWNTIENKLFQQQDANTYTINGNLGAEQGENTPLPPAAPQIYNNIEEKTDIPWLFSIWLVGVTAMITGTFMLYMIFQFKSRNVIRLKDIGYEKELGKTEVFLSDQITSPVTIGIYKPQIHLPDNIDFRDKEAVRHVLTHEMTHIKRYDNLLKVVMMVALSLHWFNPMVWILCRTLNKDIECSCDEATIKEIGEKNKADYANTLLKMAETSTAANVAGLVFVSFESSFLKERVINIMRKRYPAVLSVFIGIISAATTFAVFATNAQHIDANNIVNHTVIASVLKKEAKQEIDTTGETLQKEPAVIEKIITIIKEIPEPEEKDADDAVKDKKINLQNNIIAKKDRNEMLTADELKDAALKIVGGGHVAKWKLDKNDDPPEYEVEIINDNARHKLELNAYTGEILEYERKDISDVKTSWKNKILTAEKAGAIALENAGGGSFVTKCTLDKKNEYDVPVYDVDVRKDNLKYKYCINAYTGEILKSEAGQ